VMVFVSATVAASVSVARPLLSVAPGVLGTLPVPETLTVSAAPATSWPLVSRALTKMIAVATPSASTLFEEATTLDKLGLMGAVTLLSLPQAAAKTEKQRTMRVVFKVKE